MTTASEFKGKVSKSLTNMDRLDRLVNGTVTESVVVDSGTVPSLPKLIHDQAVQLDDLTGAVATSTAKAAEAVAARDAAVTAKTGAESARDTATAARDTATGAAATASTASTTAVSAKTAAESARDTATSARDTALNVIKPLFPPTFDLGETFWNANYGLSGGLLSSISLVNVAGRGIVLQSNSGASQIISSWGRIKKLPGRRYRVTGSWRVTANPTSGTNQFLVAIAGYNEADGFIEFQPGSGVTGKTTSDGWFTVTFEVDTSSFASTSVYLRPAISYGNLGATGGTAQTEYCIFEDITESYNASIGAGGGYNDEKAQDAIGGMVDSTLEYSDGTPSLRRAALTGDVTAAAGSNATAIALGAVTLAKQANVASGTVFYRKTGGSGAPEVQTLATLRSDMGLNVGSDVQAYDDDLAALAALSGTSTLYYRSGAGAWSAVTFSGGLSFTAGALDASTLAPKASPALTGTPTAPTASAATNSTQIATTAFVGTAIANLINGAPGALDTLKELADQFAADESVVAALTTTVSGKLTKNSNLGDLPDVAAARGNLFLGSAATLNASITSAGSGDANKVIKRDANGRIDPSTLAPPGTGFRSSRIIVSPDGTEDHFAFGAFQPDPYLDTKFVYDKQDEFTVAYGNRSGGLSRVYFKTRATGPSNFGSESIASAADGIINDQYFATFGGAGTAGHTGGYQHSVDGTSTPASGGSPNTGEGRGITRILTGSGYHVSNPDPRNSSRYGQRVAIQFNSKSQIQIPGPYEDPIAIGNDYGAHVRVGAGGEGAGEAPLRFAPGHVGAGTGLLTVPENCVFEVDRDGIIFWTDNLGNRSEILTGNRNLIGLFDPSIGMENLGIVPFWQTILSNDNDATSTRNDLGLNFEPYVLTDAATITPNFGVYLNFDLVIGGNRTMANPSNPRAGQSGKFWIKQDGTGSRSLSWGSNYRASNGSVASIITLSTGANQIDLIEYYVGTDLKVYLHINGRKNMQA